MRLPTPQDLPCSYHPTLIFTLIFLLTLTSETLARKNLESVLLSNIKTLTLRKDAQTASNRVPSIPQLKCVGGSARGLYDVDTLRCKNSGSGYTDDDIQWTCSASLPQEFKLGSTEVLCEGFSGPSDPRVLKGSCGVEYRLILTDLGEEKYGKNNGGGGTWDGGMGDGGKRTKAGDAAAVFFWIAFIGVLGWMLWAIFVRDPARRGGRRPGTGGGGGWGGGGGGGGNDDPPPPYDWRPPPSKPKASASTYPRAPRAARQQEGWRPGFWTGALGGAAAGYFAGNRGNSTPQQRDRPRGYGTDNGEGSSRWGVGGPGRGSSGSFGSDSSYGAARHESSGFGGTTRR